VHRRRIGLGPTCHKVCASQSQCRQAGTARRTGRRPSQKLVHPELAHVCSPRDGERTTRHATWRTAFRVTPRARRTRTPSGTIIGCAEDGDCPADGGVPPSPGSECASGQGLLRLYAQGVPASGVLRTCQSDGDCAAAPDSTPQRSLRTTRAIAFDRRSAPATRTGARRNVRRADQISRPQADRRARATPIAAANHHVPALRERHCTPECAVAADCDSSRPAPARLCSPRAGLQGRWHLLPPLAVRTATAPTGSRERRPRTRPRAFAPRGRVSRRANPQVLNPPGCRRTGRATTGR